MTIPAKLRTHKLSATANLSAAGFNLVGANSPAIEVMTDFGRVATVTVSPEASVVSANSVMISRGVRLLLVTGADERLEGLITARDVLGEKPVQAALSRGVKHDELTVRDLMCPLANIDTLHLSEVLNARVIDVLDALKSLGRQHILVEDVDPASGTPRVRGIFSATQIGRLLGVPVLGFDLPQNFAEIEAALAN